MEWNNIDGHYRNWDGSIDNLDSSDGWYSRTLPFLWDTDRMISSMGRQGLSAGMDDWPWNDEISWPVGRPLIASSSKSRSVDKQTIEVINDTSIIDDAVRPFATNLLNVNDDSITPYVPRNDFDIAATDSSGNWQPYRAFGSKRR